MKERGASLLTRLKLQQAYVVWSDWSAKSVAAGLHIARDSRTNRSLFVFEDDPFEARSDLSLFQSIEFCKRLLDKGVHREALGCNPSLMATQGTLYV